MKGQLAFSYGEIQKLTERQNEMYDLFKEVYLTMQEQKDDLVECIEGAKDANKRKAQEAEERS